MSDETLEQPAIPDDDIYMRQALVLAERGLFSTTPNPRVGCVFVRNGHVVATGFHEKAGGPHAEIVAIANANSHGIDLTGSTAYVTLEPCSHHGRTGPCAEALITTGVSRVVIGSLDPNPLVAGNGVKILHQAGISTTTGVLQADCLWLNRGFFSRMERGRPWVRLKIAGSADGVSALNNGSSQWITGEAARADGHHLRAQACAVLTGIGTVKADDPQLNVRGITTPRQPAKVIVDSKLEIAPESKVLANGPVYIAHAGRTAPTWLESHANRDQIRLIDATGHGAADGKTDLAELLRQLNKEGIQELHLEAGFGLNGSFLQAGLVDEIVQYIAPVFLGPGQGLFRLPELDTLPEQTSWKVRDVRQIEKDIRIVWQKK